MSLPYKSHVSSIPYGEVGLSLVVFTIALHSPYTEMETLNAAGEVVRKICQFPEIFLPSAPPTFAMKQQVRLVETGVICV